MSFTGSYSVSRVSDRMWRIMGAVLTAGAAGTIALSPDGPAADIVLDSPTWNAYDGGTLQSAVRVLIADIQPLTKIVPMRIVKTGSDRSDFLITITNPNGDDLEISGPMEIYVEFH